MKSGLNEQDMSKSFWLRLVLWYGGFLRLGTPAIRRPCSPTPRPFPSGRGCISARWSNRPGTSDSPTEGQQFSLSPGERAGVRVNAMHEPKLNRAMLLCLPFVLALVAPLRAADNLNWNTNRNLVTADIKSTGLLRVLESVASVTGWKVFLEPETIHTVSAKFKNLPPGEALHLLLGDVNFALIPESGQATRLYVFHTSQQNATMLVHPVKPGEETGKARRIPNELLVTLKPGAKIDQLARLLGAKVVGHIPNSNAYRLQFDSEDAADAARAQLAASPDVTSVNDNYVLDLPSDPRGMPSAAGGLPSLQLKPPPDSGRVIVGLIDTAVQPLSNNLDSFMLKQLSVAGQAQPNADDPTHGTAVAETLLRSLQEATKGSTSVQILPVDVYGPNSTTSTFDVANGVVQAVNGGATVLNLSLGSDADSPFLRDLLQTIIKKGITVIAAA